MNPGATELGQRRSWKRMGRRAVKDHERDLLSLLRNLAAASTPLLDTDAIFDPRAGSAVLGLSLPGRRVVLAGVGDVTAAELLEGLESTGRPTPASPALVGAGRYGAMWWIEVTHRTRMVILSSRLWIANDGGGGGATPVGEDPDDTGRVPERLVAVGRESGPGVSGPILPVRLPGSTDGGIRWRR